MIVVLMGVTASGKTTVGKVLAQNLGAEFADADDYHSAANKQKMASGQPLNDDDRRPWLETLNELMRGWQAEGKSGVLACSALKDAYRSILENGLPHGTVRIVLLDVPREVLEKRLAARRHEFMNPGLLESQLATLERPGQNAIVTKNTGSPDAIAAEIAETLNA